MTPAAESPTLPAVLLDRRETARDGGRRIYDEALDVAQFPFHVFDLQGPNGKVAHGKLVPFLAIVSWTLILGAIGILTRSFPPTGAIIAILAVSFLNAGVFKAFLSSWRGTSADTVAITSSRAESHSTSETTSRQFIEAHYTVEGVPAVSLPAQPDAKTPAGDD